MATHPKAKARVRTTAKTAGDPAASGEAASGRAAAGQDPAPLTRQTPSAPPKPFAAEAAMRTARGRRHKIEKPVKAPKLKKPKPVRDTFTMPKAEYELIELLKQRAAAKGHKVKKSELLRAGILALAGMTDARLFAAIAAVPVIKTGRPRAAAEGGDGGDNVRAETPGAAGLK